MFTSSSIPTNKKSQIYYAEKIFRICKWAMDTLLIGGITTLRTLVKERRVRGSWNQVGEKEWREAITHRMI